MPGRYSTRRRGMAPIINSIKNVAPGQAGITATTQNLLLAKAVNSPVSTDNTNVSQGSIIKAIWLSLDFCGLGGTGVLNVIDCYLIKNPGDNLTLPEALSVGTSNEKKFVIKQWRAMSMRNQDGNPPYHWEGWIKIPRRYQRMGTDDTWRLAHQSSSGVTGHISIQTIYKWYR